MVRGKFGKDDMSTRTADPATMTNYMLWVLSSGLSSKTRAAINEANKPLKPVLILSSPEFLYY